MRGGLSSLKGVRDKELLAINNQLSRLAEKVENAEEKLMDDTINAKTYKKWNKKFHI
ncbi:hypothetical protein [Mucilaginibacter sp. UR6-11]|uniref:hypothetical protein n=1 Tax=Mucilaginibacter sp. UR6-11 TaxID=1435644 RepID=UPI001E2A630B|nr:hypothetical protein [Mucilaginibacter sp. UR6-11]MCC8426589.1 hypothetical protein [Mucilaginibacter sp. UR6-11]